MPAAAATMTAPGGVTDAQLGEVTGHARAGGANPGFLRGLFATAGVPARALAAIAHLTTTQLGQVLAGANLAGANQAQVAQLLNQGTFATHAATWAGSFPATDVGRVAGRAVTAGATAPGVVAFFGTASAATASFALVGGAWTATEVGHCIGVALTAAGRPNDATLVTLFQRVVQSRGNNQMNSAPTAFRAALAGAGIAAVSWANVCTHWQTFINRYAGVKAAGGGIIGNHPFASPTMAGKTIHLQTTEERAVHVYNGHTWEHFLFTYANATRASRSSFLPAGTNARAQYDNAANGAAVRTKANQVAAAGGGFQQVNDGGFRHGIAYQSANANTIRTRLTQYYPLAGTSVADGDLVAIGRLMGKIA